MLVVEVVLGAHRPKHQTGFCQKTKVSMTIKIWISIQRLSAWVVGLGWVSGWVGGWMGHKMGPPTRLQLRLFGLLESLHIVSNLVCTCPARRILVILAMHPFLDTS